MIDNFFTDYGLITLKRKLNSYVKIYNSNSITFPYSGNMLGFGLINIETSNELLDRIKELSELLKIKILVNNNKLEIKDGS